MIRPRSKVEVVDGAGFLLHRTEEGDGSIHMQLRTYVCAYHNHVATYGSVDAWTINIILHT